MPSDKDILQQARDFLARPNYTLISYEARQLLRALADEVERLRRGDFTSEEFQSLCHNTDIQAGFDAFADGCEAYQAQVV